MLDPKIKKMLGFRPADPDAVVDEWWKKRISEVCKPCWELKYCPYGPLVEQFPIIPMTRGEAIEDYEDKRRCLKAGRFTDGKPLNKSTRAFYREWVEKFDPADYPEKLSKDVMEMGCSIYGHVCPVKKACEPFSETRELRRTGRSIPNATLLRVVRRDNSTCQICGRHLKDEEIELDHLIPLSRGGSSEESNLRVTCVKCNRRKSDRMERGE